MATSIHDEVERARAAAIPDPAVVGEYRRYAEGEQDLTLSHEQRLAAGRLCDHQTIDNACDLVLTTAASRLEFTGYRVEDPAVQEYLDGFVVKNHLADIQYDCHYRTLRDGNHYLGLAWTPERQTAEVVRPMSPGPPGLFVEGGDDPTAATASLAVPPGATTPTASPGGRVSVHHEPAWDGESGMFVGYDALGAPAFAVKDFTQLLGDAAMPVTRRVIYFPDHLERYIDQGDGWRAYALPGDPNPNGIVPWTKRDGSPLGVPVVHFSHGRFGRAPYGASDLAGILGLQDHLNAALLDLAASAQVSAFPMLKVKGIDPADGKLVVGPGRVVGSSNPNSDVDFMTPGDLGQLESYHGRLLDVIARATSTPQHLIGAGAWPSGLALYRADATLTAKVHRLGTTVGPAWATLGHRATELANAFGGLALDEDALVVAVFAPAEYMDMESRAAWNKQQAEAFATASTITDPVMLEKTGLFTSEEVAQIVGDRQAAAAMAPVVAAF